MGGPALGFFRERRSPDLGPPDLFNEHRYARVLNVPPTISCAVSSELVTFAELATVLSLEDLWDVLEINAVNRHNEAIMQREAHS